MISDVSSSLNWDGRCENKSSTSARFSTVQPSQDAGPDLWPVCFSGSCLTWTFRPKTSLRSSQVWPSPFHTASLMLATQSASYVGGAYNFLWLSSLWELCLGGSSVDLSLVFWFLVLFPCLWIRGDLNHLSYDWKHHHVRRTGKPQDHQTVFAAVHSLTLTLV